MSFFPGISLAFLRLSETRRDLGQNLPETGRDPSEVILFFLGHLSGEDSRALNPSLWSTQYIKHAFGEEIEAQCDASCFLKVIEHAEGSGTTFR